MKQNVQQSFVINSGSFIATKLIEKTW